MGKIAEIEKILIETDETIKKERYKYHPITTHNGSMKLFIKIQQIESCAYDKIYKILMEEK